MQLTTMPTFAQLLQPDCGVSSRGRPSKTGVDISPRPAAVKVKGASFGIWDFMVIGLLESRNIEFPILC